MLGYQCNSCLKSTRCTFRFCELSFPKYHHLHESSRFKPSSLAHLAQLNSTILCQNLPFQLLRLSQLTNYFYLLAQTHLLWFLAFRTCFMFYFVFLIKHLNLWSSKSMSWPFLHQHMKNLGPQTVACYRFLFSFYRLLLLLLSAGTHLRNLTFFKLSWTYTQTKARNKCCRQVCGKISS